MLIDRISDVLDQYLTQLEARHKGEAAAEDESGMDEDDAGPQDDEDADADLPVGDSEEDAFLGDLEEEEDR